MRDAVKFNGRPEELTLKYATGRECSNGSYLYTLLNDERALFATPALNDQIQAKRPQPGMRLSIQLMGNNRWEVKPVDPPAGRPELVAPINSQAVAAGPYQNAQQGNGTNGQSREQLMNQLGQVIVNGIPDSTYSHTGWAAFLREQATALIDVAASCHRYAAEKYPGMLRAEDVSDLVTTAFINLSKQGGAR